MSTEAQRIAIAEACGWTSEYAYVPKWNAELNNYEGCYETIKTRVFRRKEKCVFTEDLPDYLSDLNAMHEAEKVLTATNQPDRGESQWSEYLGWLGIYSENGHKTRDLWQCVTASAAQRAEAFLRTIGKWENKP